MKTLILVLALVSAMQAFGMDRSQAERLLSGRQLSLQQLEQGGGRLLIGGEVTGGGRALPAERVQVVLVRDRAILKREIESMDFSPVTGKLSDLDSFRVGGSYYTREDIRGVVIK